MLYRLRLLLPPFFFFQIEETCTFMNISGLKYHRSVIQMQKTVLPCVNFIMGERGYRRWDLMLTHACWGEWLNFYVYTQLSYIASILFTRINFACTRSQKLRHSGNPPKRAATYTSHYLSLDNSYICRNTSKIMLWKHVKWKEYRWSENKTLLLHEP